MARPGRTQKSAAALDLAGTARADRPRAESLPAIPLQYVPDPPTWLDEDVDAVKEWRRLAPLLVADGLLAEKDLQTLANLCRVQSKIIRGLDTKMVVHAVYARYASALGLAAGWRARAASGAAPEKPKTNPFEDFKTN